MATVRSPAVAGTFYPANKDELHTMITGLLAEASGKTAATPKAVIAPHAGYIYSGSIAASAYARLVTAGADIRRVILLGPSHRVPLRGLAAPRSEVFATPLGDVPVDGEAITAISDLPQVQIMDEAHAIEHSLEVHLPFLQEVLEQFTLVPLVVGDASAEEVAEVLERLWGGPETLIVISSDLSHYYDYETARRMDAATREAIEQLRPEDIGFEQACGRIPVSGLLLAARRKGLHVETVDLRNSGDTAGPRDQVVGYGAWVLD